jgi:acetyl esterase
MPALPVVQVASVEDIGPGDIAPGVRARLYKADGAPSQPLVVFYHGGGFVMGGLDSHDGFCRQLCAGIGCTVLAVDYRLAPEHRFPAATDDALAALRWAHAHAERLGVDASRIIVAGDSAGGNLAAVTALRSRDEAGPALLGQILFCPVVEFHRDDRPSMRENGEGPFLTTAEMAFCTGSYLQSRADTENPHAAPLRAASLRGLPPALVITAEYDPLRDEGEAYAGRLEADGVAVRMTRYDGTIHDFMVMPGPRASEDARQQTYKWARTRFFPS